VIFSSQARSLTSPRKIARDVRKAFLSSRGISLAKVFGVSKLTWRRANGLGAPPSHSERISKPVRRPGARVPTGQLWVPMGQPRPAVLIPVLCEAVLKLALKKEQKGGEERCKQDHERGEGDGVRLRADVNRRLLLRPPGVRRYDRGQGHQPRTLRLRVPGGDERGNYLTGLSPSDSR
jgi:hypothetical protein